MAEHHPTPTIHAYVLINVDPTKTHDILDRLEAIPGSRVHEVLGPYDIVLELEADAPEYLTHMLREKVRPVPGVLSTVTCTWMD